MKIERNRGGPGKWAKTLVKYGLAIHLEKSKILKVNRNKEPKRKVILEGKDIERVDEFSYIGSNISMVRYKGIEE